MDSSRWLPPTDAPAPADGWFDALPEEHRARILAEDAAHLDQWAEVERKRARAWWRPCAEAALLLGATASFVNGLSWSALAAGLVSGAVAGALWHRTNAGRLGSMLIAVALFFAGLILTGQLTIAAVIWAPLPIGCVSVFCGLRREELPGS